MNESSKMVIVLTAITVIAGALLSGVYLKTKDAIEAAQRQEFLDGLNVVLPAHDNTPDTDAVTLGERTVYVAKKEGKTVAYAMKTSSKKGYGGNINVLIGVGADGKVTGVQVLSHAETPGLGDKILAEDFRNSFKGLSAADEAKIHVKKDGGIIDQFSGATISPRAVCEAVREGVLFLSTNLPKGAQ